MENEFSNIVFCLDDFYVVYQPIYDITTHKTIKIETLLRWKKSNDVNGFIAFFEATGQIKELTKFVVLSVCADFPQLCSVWACPVVTINFSPVVLANRDFCREIVAVFAMLGIQSQNIKIEITETGALNAPGIIEGGGGFEQHGFKLILDDFGMGSTSLYWLIQLPINLIKIDKCFISQVGGGGVADGILSSLSFLSSKLDIDCVAEGIETQEQEDALKRIGIRYGQGFLYSKPIPLDHLLAFLLVETGNKTFPKHEYQIGP